MCENEEKQDGNTDSLSPFALIQKTNGSFIRMDKENKTNPHRKK